ncbi:MAG: hypothetical protein V7754_03860 [Halioglobus sp.]
MRRIFLATLFAMNVITAHAGTENSSCELMYAAHPHKHADEAIGQQRLDKTLALDFSGMEAFSEVFIPLTDEFSRQFLESIDKQSISLGQQTIVLGGYEGETIPSVVIPVTVSGEQGYKQLIQLAALIGHVYAQDSTLVICDGSVGGEWQQLESLEVLDRGPEKFLVESNIPMLFGMMIGAAGTAENIGFTYYSDTQMFSTLSYTGGDLNKEEVLEQVGEWIHAMSNGDVSLAVGSKSVAVFFPHNDWENYPMGSHYFPYLQGEEQQKMLIEWRKDYLRVMDEFLTEED